MHPTSTERVLVLAPTPTDAALCRSVMGDAGLECASCDDVNGLCTSLGEGAAAVLITEEVLDAGGALQLIAALGRQPSWSDLPILMLSRSGAETVAAAEAAEMLGNLTVLERPVRVTTLLSSLRAAIRARRRQYTIRDQLIQLQHASGALRKQGDSLRLLWETASVLLTTDEPDTMVRELFGRIAGQLELDAFFCFRSEENRALRLQSHAGIDEKAALDIAAAALERDGDVAASRDAAQLTACFCRPLTVGGRLLGVLGFASRRRPPFHGEEQEFLQTISNYVTVAWERVRLIRELREAGRRKDEFLATLAHELRNPLAPIRNALQVLQVADGDAALMQRARGMMERQLAQMVRLIDDLMDVSRITRGSLELRREPVTLAAVMRSALDTAEPLIAAAGHRLSLDLPDEALRLDADPVRLAQVFSNLLNNAAKYTPRGGRIHVAARTLSGQVEVTVIDNGAGIPADQIDKVFELFTQADSTIEKSHGGLGIGLTLVRRLVEMHGGTVSAHSKGAGHGATFVVVLPLGNAATDGPPADRLPAHAEGGSLRVLVADDNRDAAESMGLILRLMGNEVRTAYDGRCAIDVAARFHPDLVLLDIGMPRINGYEAARRIRESPAGRQAMLVAVTGWGQAEDRRLAAEAGFDHHFTKPVDPSEIAALLAGLGDRGNGCRGTKRSEESRR